MDQADFPWQQLGSLLVEDDLLSPDELERALEEQRRTGRPLGEILVDQGSMSGTALARALARQHGVDLRPGDTQLPAPKPKRASSWRPLGTVLVEGGWLTESQLDEALAEKRAHQDRRLGEILIRRGYISGVALAIALAEQHGVELERESLSDTVETVTVPVPPGKPTYQVCTVTFEGGRSRTALYEGPNLLDAADFACDYIDREEPAAVEIERREGESSETVWTYSREEAETASNKSNVETFGFDPARWDVRT